MSSYDCEEENNKSNTNRRIIKWDQPTSNHISRNKSYDRSSQFKNHNKTNSSNRSLQYPERFRSEDKNIRNDIFPNRKENYFFETDNHNENIEELGSSDSLHFNTRYGPGKSNDSLHLMQSNFNLDQSLENQNYARSSKSRSIHNSDVKNSYNHIYNEREREREYDLNRARINEVQSKMEAEVLNARKPIFSSETTTVSVNGTTGVWLNKKENYDWRGLIPIEKYKVNIDSNPIVINKKSDEIDCVQSVQEIKYKYLRPPPPEPAGDIIIKQEPDVQLPPAPPLIIREEPNKQPVPEKIILREEPPEPPKPLPSITINVPGKQLPPPPRKVIIERMPQMPQPPQEIIVERWLDYPEQVRRVRYVPAEPLVPMPKPRNVVIVWDSPEADVKRHVNFLGVEMADPNEYLSRHRERLINAKRLPSVAIEAANILPNSERLAAKSRARSVPKLIGDVDALGLIDLDKAGLIEYKNQLNYKNSSNMMSKGISTLGLYKENIHPRETFNDVALRGDIGFNPIEKSNYIENNKSFNNLTVDEFNYETMRENKTLSSNLVCQNIQPINQHPTSQKPSYSNSSGYQFFKSLLNNTDKKRNTSKLWKII